MQNYSLSLLSWAFVLSLTGCYLEQIQAAPVQEGMSGDEIVGRILPESKGRASAHVNKWYEGGTLHSASRNEWRAASYNNKLATCADFITALWEEDQLEFSISMKLSTVEDVRPYAVDLVTILNEAHERELDQTLGYNVPGVAALSMLLKGWLLY